MGVPLWYIFHWNVKRSLTRRFTKCTWLSTWLYNVENKIVTIARDVSIVENIITIINMMVEEKQQSPNIEVPVKNFQSLDETEQLEKSEDMTYVASD